MGNQRSSTSPKQDITSVIFKLKMASKRFAREAEKSTREKEKNLKLAKACLKKGNEEGARLYASNAQSNLGESKKYLSMSTRLDVISGQLKTNSNFSELMKGVSKEALPVLNAEAESMDLASLSEHFHQFSDVFDRLEINGKTVSATFDKQNTRGQVEGTDTLLAQLRNEASYEISKDSSQPVVEFLPVKGKQEGEEVVDEFIGSLRK